MNHFITKFIQNDYNSTYAQTLINFEHGQSSTAVFQRYNYSMQPLAIPYSAIMFYYFNAHIWLPISILNGGGGGSRKATVMEKNVS